MLKFANEQHLYFYTQMLEACPKPDVYHQALLYLLGVSEETRVHAADIYDINEDTIKLESLNAGWQTGGSTKLCLLAFNLWNGFTNDETSPSDIFCCSYAPYMLAAVKLRFPEYTTET